MSIQTDIADIRKDQDEFLPILKAFATDVHAIALAVTRIADAIAPVPVGIEIVPGKPTEN
jgi:hypothetical protein